MTRLSKIVILFITFYGALISSQPVLANNIEDLNWLALLTVNMQRLQPDRNCPQNQIYDLQVNKDEQEISSHIREVNWDLDCTPNKKKPTSGFEAQRVLSRLLQQLAVFPLFKLNFNRINLTSELIKTTFSTNLLINKSLSTIFFTFKSDLLQGKVSLNLQSKELLADVALRLNKLPDYIQLADQQDRYFNGELLLHYHSDLNFWQKGDFKVDWQGSLPDFSHSVELSIEGEVDLLKEYLILSTFLVNAKQVLVPISERQSWKADYIKVKNNGSAIVHYKNMQVERFPVHLRVANSTLLTKVKRGKSKRVRLDKQKLPPLFMQLAISGQETDLLIDWRVTLLNQKLSGKLFLEPEFIKIQVLENSIDIRSLVESANSYVVELESVDIEKGRIKLDLLAQYQRQKKTIMFDSQLIAANISGKKDNITFDGVTFTSDLHYLIDAQNKITILKDKQQLKVANVFVGVPIQALQVDATLEGGDPIVQHFKARLLGGRLDFDDFKLNAPSQTILNIGGISLAEIIKYSAYPEIKSQAVIDGMLPLRLTATGPEITDGVIFARPPGGYIKVPENTVIKAMGRGNPAFSFTMQLLSNFQFDTMLGRIGYTSDGESDLNIEIKGISPNVSGTQPINFNYSHNENILKLLKSLRFNDELVRDIKERY